MALVIARLLEGEEAESFKWVLTDHLLPHAKENNDLWLQSICYWLLKQHATALECLTTASNSRNVSPNMIDFFKFLSNHAVLRNNTVPLERTLPLYQNAIYGYKRSNCELLAIRLALHMHQEQVLQSGVPVQISNSQLLKDAVVNFLATQLLGLNLSNYERDLAIWERNLQYLCDKLQISSQYVKEHVHAILSLNDCFSGQVLIAKLDRKKELFFQQLSSVPALCERMISATSMFPSQLNAIKNFLR